MGMWSIHWGFPGGAIVKNPPANAEDVRDMGSILGSGRFPGGEHGNLLQYSCLENMDRGAWWATVHRVVKSWTGLKWLSMHAWSVQPHKTYSWLNTLLSQSWNLLILFEKRTSPFPLALGPTNYTASVQCRGLRGAHQVVCCLLFLGLGMELPRKAFRCPLPI